MLLYFFSLFIFSCAAENNPAPCTSGTYSAGGLAVCTPCSIGSYCPNNKTISPIPCPLGTYANVTGLPLCKACPAGHKCANTSATPVECEDGTYSLSGRSECIQCPSGKR